MSLSKTFTLKPLVFDLVLTILSELGLCPGKSLFASGCGNTNPIPLATLYTVPAIEAFCRGEVLQVVPERDLPFYTRIVRLCLFHY